MKLDIKAILIVVLSAILLFSVKKCSDYQQDNTQLTLANQRLDSAYNLKNQLLISSQTEIATSQQQLRDATDSFFAMNKKWERRIKEVLAFYRTTTITRIDSTLVPYVDSAAMVAWADSIKQQCQGVIDYYEANYLALPKTARDSTDKYVADFTATQSGININTLAIPDSQYLRFVVLKGGILKKDQNGKRHLFTPRSYQVQVLHTNPLIQTTSTSSVIYRPPKRGKWLEKTLLIGAGIFLGTKL